MVIRIQRMEAEKKVIGPTEYKSSEADTNAEACEFT